MTRQILESRRVAVALAVVLGVSAAGARAQGCPSWQSVRLSPSVLSLQTVAWGYGRFLVFETALYGNHVHASVDGSSWVDLGSANAPLGQVRSLGGTLFGVGPLASLWTSTDGLNWVQRFAPAPASETLGLSDMAWNGSTYVGVGAGVAGYQIYHPVVVVANNDAQGWSTVALPEGFGSSEQLLGVVWTGTRFVAVGINSASGGVVLVSDDGRSWNRIPGPGGASVAWNGRELVAVGDINSRGATWRSADGVTWEKTLNDWWFSPGAVTWDGAQFVVVGQATMTGNALVMTSPDGAVWQATQVPPVEDLIAVASHAGTTVAVGVNGTVVTQGCVPGEPAYVPAAAHLAGVNGSSWRTDLEVHNPGTARISYAVELLARDADNSAPAARAFTADPGTSVRHVDALASLFSFTGAATLRVTPLGGALIADARTYDDAPAGSYGQFVEGRGATAAVPAGAMTRIIHLSQAADRSTGFRTNLGLVSASPLPMTVVVDLFRADGTQLGELSVPLRPYESVQRNEVLLGVAAGPVDDGYAVVQSPTPGAFFFAYATVIDNRTNDPVYIPAR